ncbi:MAG: helix-turn-helix transcriptional regulator [Lachnospiraceae bacterium]|nr:helix-turn-helix transcriptional regulator [Lachnospiraceae bacterium]
MEFNEKLQKLRKDRGLTQEELAEALFVSRTAISKWESGRGYPSIDSLKEISKFFSVTIDELLSTERLLSIAERENKSNIQKMCNLLLGIVDLFSFMLIVLPLYPNPVNGYIYAVNLFNYTETTSFNKLIYWIMFLSLIVVGAVKIVLTQCKIEKGQNIVTGCSMVLSILTVLFLAMTREAYAITLVFMLLIIKGMLLFKYSKNA